MKDCYIRDLLLRNNKAVERAMVVLNNRQTEVERNSGVTLESNGRGFNAFDAKMGTYYADWVLRGKSLSGTHLAKARKMALKYIGQLQEEADAKAERTAIQAE